MIRHNPGALGLRPKRVRVVSVEEVCRMIHAFHSISTVPHTVTSALRPSPYALSTRCTDGCMHWMCYRCSTSMI